ncbi:flagellar biosynthetic protein FliR [Ectobacillus ponti]|uniref:Flagellar type III secretion system protein FliR n=1 Tax=Ectobacillus ponti TaxID=2961894 RepID=A0AA41X501_9BACI|nr:flagellar biosynthetic protein FliR [Ectobacillus ponti]MCP8968867.1 flagellar type III secretion system protein FliR [Ectobacillus ponti]
MNMELLTAMFLAFCRIGSFLFFLPVFSSRALPAMAKMVFGLALAASVADRIPLEKIDGVPALFAYAATQIIIGIALAKIVELFMSIPKMAGNLIDMDMGLAQVTLFDYNAGSQATALAILLDIFFVIVFISLGGIDYLVLAIMKSFQYTETAAALLHTDFLKMVLSTLLFAMTSAVEIALPIMGSLFIINFVMLIIGKSAPQLNIFANAAMVKLTVGILIMGASVPMLGFVFKNLTARLLEEYTNVFNFFLTK